MAFYKLCDCGKKVTFEQKWSAPRKCPFCTRELTGATMDEDAVAAETEQEPAQEPHCDDVAVSRVFYALVTPDGTGEIIIPPEGGIVGRDALGADLLEHHLSVSRNHIKVSYRGQIGLQIEDRSSFGTSLNGVRMVKGVPQFAKDGDQITLNKFLLIVRRHEEG